MSIPKLEMMGVVDTYRVNNTLFENKLGDPSKDMISILLCCNDSKPTYFPEGLNIML